MPPTLPTPTTTARQDAKRLRRTLRAQRKAIAPAKRIAAGRRAARLLVRQHRFRAAGDIALFLAMGEEISADPLIRIAQRHGKRLYVPLILPGQRMRFVPLLPDTVLTLNRFGIREPEPGAHPGIDPRRLDLVVTPLLGFDRRGSRLGMGGGFYDRHFAFLRHRRRYRRPFLLGMTYAIQELPHIDRQPWDVPLHAIVTECEWISTPSQPYRPRRPE